MRSFSPRKSVSPEKKPYTGKPRGRKPKNASIGSVAEVENIISGHASETKPEGSPRRGRPPKRVGRPPKQINRDNDNQMEIKEDLDTPGPIDEDPDSNMEIIVEASPKKRGRKPKSWHLENQRLEQLRQMEKLKADNQANAVLEEQEQELNSATTINTSTHNNFIKEEPKLNSPKIVSPTSNVPNSAPAKSIPKAIPIKSPPAPVFVPPVIRKKAKKKSWIVAFLKQGNF